MDIKKHLTGQEKMSTLRKMAKDLPALFTGISFSGKGRTKPLITKEMNACIRVHNVEVQKMQIHESDMNLMEREDCRLNLKTFRCQAGGQGRTSPISPWAVMYARMTLFLLLWICTMTVVDTVFLPITILPLSFPFVLVAALFGAEDILMVWMLCFFSTLSAISISEAISHDPILSFQFGLSSAVLLVCSGQII